MSSLLDQMNDDLDLIFDLSAFAREATVGGRTVNGIFDRPYKEETGISGFVPVLYCKSSDVATVAEGTAVVIDGVSYEVVVPQPDGSGVTALVLEVV